MDDKINENINEFLKNSKFKKNIDEGKALFTSAIFICKLNTKKKRIAIPKETLKDFLSSCKDFLKEYTYLLDENGGFKFTKLNIGYNLPVKKDDLQPLLDILIKAKEEYFNKKDILLSIEMSHKDPNSEFQYIKTQFKNMPSHLNKYTTKETLETFGEIKDLHIEDGIWTILYSKINWFLPYMYHLHLKKSKVRWFNIDHISISFSSKATCKKCKIPGHSKPSCPGDILISKIKEGTNILPKEKEEEDRTSNSSETSDSSNSDSSDDSSSYDPKKRNNKQKKKTATKKTTTKNKNNDGNDIFTASKPAPKQNTKPKGTLNTPPKKVEQKKTTTKKNQTPKKTNKK